jgi:protein farnesyltransferase subunit beta
MINDAFIAGATERIAQVELDTTTSLEQERVQSSVLLRYHRFMASGVASVALRRARHAEFLWDAVDAGVGVSSSLDALQTWLCYWTLNALDLLDELDRDDDEDESDDDDNHLSANKSSFRVHMANRVAAHLALRQHRDGGFCGFPCDALPHLASTYAAVNALVIMGTDAALAAIDRRGMQRFLLERKCARTGGFSMHVDGEIDVRGVYCAMSIAALLNIATPALLEGAGAFLVSCQSYEGGLGGTPGGEAHGGYSYCGLAAALLIEELRASLGMAPEPHPLDYERLLHWVSRRQMQAEGGFQGRTNKLVDSCYSWWQGAVFALLHRKLRIGSAQLLCNAVQLQAYVFICCQDEDGGLFDKPGRQADFYHTCYALSGVAAIQWGGGGGGGGERVVLGAAANELPEMDLLHCMRRERAEHARQVFHTQRLV